MAIDGFLYEGANAEYVKEGLRDVAAECILVVFRRPAAPSNPDASLENILPGVPMSRPPVGKKPKRLFGTLSFNRGGKTYRRASKCGGSMYCHCQECYANSLRSKEDEMRQLFVSAQQTGQQTRMDIQFSAKNTAFDANSNGVDVLV